MDSLTIISRLGLSSFLTVGFAAALGASAGPKLNSPYFEQACGGFFFWALALSLGTTSRQA